MTLPDIIGNGRVAGIAILCAVFFTGCPKRNDVATAERLGRIAADSDAAQKAVDDDRKADAAAALGLGIAFGGVAALSWFSGYE